MTRSLSFALSMAGVLIPALWLQAAQSDTSSVHPGQMFPQLSGQTLTGKSVELPAATMGKPAVVIVSFSKTAGNDARSWNERLSRDSKDVPSYTIIVLESVPKLFRGLAVSSIKGSMPVPMQDRTFVLYSDEKLWKQRVAFSGDSRAYVILLGPDGRIRCSSKEAFTEPSYAQMKDQLDKLLRPHS
jgi:ATP10 protein